MARLAGIEMKDKDRVVYALTRISGIGWNKAHEIMLALKMDEKRRMSELSNEDLATLTNKLDGYVIEGDLARRVRGDIQRLKDIGTYRGGRHARGLPVRGQRTRTNARTKRGKRKTVGAFKKEVLSKMSTNAKEEPKSEK